MYNVIGVKAVVREREGGNPPGRSSLKVEANKALPKLYNPPSKHGGNIIATWTQGWLKRMRGEGEMKFFENHSSPPIKPKTL
jgi:hypothetical protein